MSRSRTYKIKCLKDQIGNGSHRDLGVWGNLKVPTRFPVFDFQREAIWSQSTSETLRKAHWPTAIPSSCQVSFISFKEHSEPQDIPRICILWMLKCGSRGYSPVKHSKLENYVGAQGNRNQTPQQKLVRNRHGSFGAWDPIKFLGIKSFYQFTNMRQIPENSGLCD